jgi:hypothetical protein
MLHMQVASSSPSACHQVLSATLPRTASLLSNGQQQQAGSFSWGSTQALHCLAAYHGILSAIVKGCQVSTSSPHSSTSAIAGTAAGHSTLAAQVAAAAVSYGTGGVSLALQAGAVVSNACLGKLGEAAGGGSDAAMADADGMGSVGAGMSVNLPSQAVVQVQHAVLLILEDWLLLTAAAGGAAGAQPQADAGELLAAAVDLVCQWALAADVPEDAPCLNAHTMRSHWGHQACPATQAQHCLLLLLSTARDHKGWGSQAGQLGSSVLGQVSGALVSPDPGTRSRSADVGAAVSAQDQGLSFALLGRVRELLVTGAPGVSSDVAQVRV